MSTLDISEIKEIENRHGDSFYFFKEKTSKRNLNLVKKHYSCYTFDWNCFLAKKRLPCI